MSSCCTLRLNRRSAFSSGSPSCKRTSAKGSHLQTCQKGPRMMIWELSRINQVGENPRKLRDLDFATEIEAVKQFLGENDLIQLTTRDARSQALATLTVEVECS